MTGQEAREEMAVAGRQVCVAGLGVSGAPAALALASLGAKVTAVDDRDDDDCLAVAARLRDQGVRVLLGKQATALPPGGTELVVTSPGWLPSAPLLVAAAAAGVDVIGDVELAWRLRPRLPGGGRQCWLAVTGTNGKTTTARMLALMLRAAGLHAIEAGNVGFSLVDVVTAAEPCEVVAVELSSFQLHWTSTITPLAAAVLNVAAHHLDWHGDIDAYATAKAKIFTPGTIAIGNADDPRSAAMVAAAGASGKASRVVMFRLGEPAAGEFGIADGFLVDRACDGSHLDGPYLDGPEPSAVRLAAVGDVTGSDPAARARPPASHNIANALAAAALARAYGVPADAISAGLMGFRPDPHRICLVGSVDGVDYVDDSKATNPHAAAASLAAYDPVVWVAGGLLKGGDPDLDQLVAAAAPRLRGVVLLGADRSRIAAALGRRAPRVRVVEIASTGAGAMEVAVGAAARMAEPGDTVLLAPAAQSYDMFRDYPARGEAFAAAVKRLAEAQ